VSESCVPDSRRAVQFAKALAHGVAELGTEDPTHDAIELTSGLSAWMGRTSVGLEEAWAGVLMLRLALLEVAGLDLESEPTPLRPGDPKIALVGMTVYLDGLLERAARATAKGRWAVAGDAVGRLSA